MQHIRELLLLAFALRNDIDEDQRADQQQERVKQIRDDLKCRHVISERIRCREGDEHLSTVGNDALKYAGEGIEQGSGLPLEMP